MSRRTGMRTRVYASNLGVVENNYKEAMARLERSRRPSSADRELKSRASPLSSRQLLDFNGDDFDEDLLAARSRASKVIHEKSVIDSRAEQLRSHSLAPVSSVDDFDDQVQATLNRIRASKNYLSQLQYDDSLEDVQNEARSKLNETNTKKLAEKMSSYEDSDSFASSNQKQSVRKTLKIRSVADSSSSLSSDAKSSLKWRDETAESFAAKRANATKARLQDIDLELQDFEEKQAARARRSAQLKKLLAETACEDVFPATTTERAGTKVTTGMVKFKSQKKVVSF